MNLMDAAQLLGNFGEFVGAIAVVVTLAYLATQIRQNTVAQRSSSSLETTRSFTDWFSTVMTDPELVRIFSAGFEEDPDELADEDRARFVWMLAALTSRVDEMYTQHKAGLINDDRWFKYRGIIVGALRYPVVKEWWDSGATYFDSGFIEEIEATDPDQSDWRPESMRVLRSP